MPDAPFYTYAQHSCLRGRELLPSPIVYYGSVVRKGWNGSGLLIINWSYDLKEKLHMRTESLWLLWVLQTKSNKKK